MDADFRRVGERDSARWLAGLDRAMELDAACPETRVVSVCDREGDFRQLLSRARDRQAALPVRASKSARRRVVARDGKIRDLWARVGLAAPVGGRVTGTPKCGGPNRRSGRTVRLTLRCLEVDPLPPRDVGGPPMRMLAVSAREGNPPAAVARKGEALDWMLLTTEGEPDLENACTVLRWHQLRWRTGRFFHALKVGTRIGDRRLDEADDPRKCLAFDAITAFRVRNLTFPARERPDDPARMYAGPDEIEVLFALAASLGPTPPRGPPDPDVGTFVVLTAGLAGFHPSKRQPMPGNRKLWQGRSRFREGSWDIRPRVTTDADGWKNRAEKSQTQVWDIDSPPDGQLVRGLRRAPPEAGTLPTRLPVRWRHPPGDRQGRSAPDHGLAVAIVALPGVAGNPAAYGGPGAVGLRRDGPLRKTAFPQSLDLASVVPGQVVIAGWHAIPSFAQRRRVSRPPGQTSAC